MRQMYSSPLWLGALHIVTSTKINAFSIAVGKTLAFTSIKFMNDKDEIFARGSHTK